MQGDISEFEREHRLNFAALSAGSPFVAMIWMSAMQPVLFLLQASIAPDEAAAAVELPS